MYIHKTRMRHVVDDAYRQAFTVCLRVSVFVIYKLFQSKFECQQKSVKLKQKFKLNSDTFLLRLYVVSTDKQLPTFRRTVLLPQCATSQNTGILISTSVRSINASFSGWVFRERDGRTATVQLLDILLRSGIVRAARIGKSASEKPHVV